MNRIALIIFLTSILLSGCSGAVTSPDAAIDDVTVGTAQAMDSGNWTWGHWTIRISEDHNSAEVVPVRESSLHLNVTKFVEGPPCPDCMWIGKAWGLPDGTVKLQINLMHPYYFNPEFTGFDVRGIVIFRRSM